MEQSKITNYADVVKDILVKEDELVMQDQIVCEVE